MCSTPCQVLSASVSNNHRFPPKRKTSKHELRHQHPGVLDEVDPLDVQRAEDAARIDAAQPEHVDLNHPGTVFQEVARLRDQQRIKQNQPLVRA